MTAGSERSRRFQYFCTAMVPGGLPVVGSVRTYSTMSPCSLLSSRSCETPSLAARPVMCEAGREEPFDELSAWTFSPTLTWHTTCWVISAPHIATRRGGEKHICNAPWVDKMDPPINTTLPEGSGRRSCSLIQVTNHEVLHGCLHHHWHLGRTTVCVKRSGQRDPSETISARLAGVTFFCTGKNNKFPKTETTPDADAPEGNPAVGSESFLHYGRGKNYDQRGSHDLLDAPEHTAPSRRPKETIHQEVLHEALP